MEVKDYLITRMREGGFKPRSSTKHENEFDNQWMTDSKWSEYRTRQTEWLNTTVSTLEQVGEVTFANKDIAYTRLANANYLPTVVARLTNDEHGIEIENIIHSEKDADKRFLKVVYRLNPSLPFRLGNLRFKTIRDILAVTAGSYSMYADLYFSFQKGHLQIWLTETDTASAAKLSSETAYTDFLRFVFSIAPAHPFYLKENRFETPQQLAAMAVSNLSLWSLIAGGMYHNELPAWFSGIGHADWIQQYNEQYNAFVDSPYHNGRDKEMAAVQTLLLVIDESLEAPRVMPEPAAVKMPAVEGSGKVQYPVQVSLENAGFVKVQLSLSATIPGISLSESELTLHSQNQISSGQFFVYADGMALVKNKLYSLNIIAETAYGQVVIPVEIKVVFPQKSYTKLLLKYAVIGAVLLGVIRFALGALINYEGWLSNAFSGSYLSFDISEYYLPPEYPFFILMMAVLFISLIASFYIIRKAEKI